MYHLETVAGSIVRAGTSLDREIEKLLPYDSSFLFVDSATCVRSDYTEAGVLDRSNPFFFDGAFCWSACDAGCSDCRRPWSDCFADASPCLLRMSRMCIFLPIGLKKCASLALARPP